MMNWRLLGRLVSVLALALNLHAASAEAAELTRWQWLNPLPQGNALQDVAWDGNRWLAVGSYSTLVASTNGVDWSSLPFTNNFQATSIATSGETTVIVGWSNYSPQADEFRTALMVSTNGSTWTPAINGVINAGLIGVAYGGGRWVAVGAYRILISEDGVVWNSIERPRADIISGVSHAGGRFFVLGASGMILSSANGIDFDDVTPAAAYNKTFVSAAYTNGRWVVVGANGVCYRSTNAIDWEAGTAGSDYLFEVAAWNSQFIALDGTGRLLASQDGQTWANAGAKVPGLQSLAWNGSQIVAAGNARIATGASPKGFNPIHTPMLNNIFGVVELQGKLMAWGLRAINSSKSTGYVAMAESRAPWKAWQVSDTPEFNNVAVANGILVGAGSSGKLYTSVDGTNWIGRSTGIYSSLRPIASSPNLIVVGGGNGTILTSPTGEEWTASTLPVSWNIADLLYHDGLFVAALDTGRIYTSPDAKEWMLQFPGDGWSLFALSWIEGLGFSVTGSRPDYNRVLLSSLDGMEWNEQMLNWPGTVSLGRVHDSAQGLVALDRGYAMVSLDKGGTWERVPVPFGNTLGAAMVSDRLVAYGESGTLLELPGEPPPVLSISRMLTMVRITWPETAADWTLESNTSLANPAGWVRVDLTFTEYWNRVSEQPLGADARYFRLKK